MESRSEQPAIPAPVREALDLILYYLMDDERESFRDDPSPGHLFRHLVTVDQWLNSHAATAEELAADD